MNERSFIVKAWYFPLLYRVGEYATPSAADAPGARAASPQLPAACRQQLFAHTTRVEALSRQAAETYGLAARAPQNQDLSQAVHLKRLAGTKAI